MLQSTGTNSILVSYELLFGCNVKKISAIWRSQINTEVTKKKRERETISQFKSVNNMHNNVTVLY